MNANKKQSLLGLQRLKLITNTIKFPQVLIEIRNSRIGYNKSELLIILEGALHSIIMSSEKLQTNFFSFTIKAHNSSNTNGNTPSQSSYKQYKINNQSQRQNIISRSALRDEFWQDYKTPLEPFIN